MDTPEIVDITTLDSRPDMEAEDRPQPEDLLPAATVVSQVMAMYRRAYDDSIEWRRRGHDARRLYNLDYSEEFRGKKDWQSQHPLPTVYTAVNFVANGITDAVAAWDDDWLTVEGETPLGDVIAPVFKALIRQDLEREDFAGQFQTALVDGLLLGAPVFQCYPVADGPWAGYARLESTDMTRILRDPTGRGKFLIFVDVRDLDDVLADAETQGYDPAAVTELRTTATGSRDDEDDWRREWSEMLSLDANSDVRRPVQLIEYYGPFWDDAKRQVIPFGRCLIANQRLLLRAPEPDPYGDTTIPFVHGDIVPRQGAAYGPAYAAVSATLAKAKVRAFNMALDSMSRAGFNAVEMDESNATPSAIAAAKSQNLAGAVLRKKGPGPLFSVVSLGHFHPEIIAIMQLIDQEYQAATNATDLNRGIPNQSGTSEQTATEFRGKIELSGRALRGTARAVEGRTLEPLAKLLAHYLREFGSVDDPGVQSVAAEALAEARQMAARYLEEQGQPVSPLTVQMVLQAAWTEPLNVSVGGISAVLDAKEQAEALVGIMGVVLGLERPDEPPLVDRAGFAAQLLRLNGIKAEGLLVPEEDRARMAEQMAMAQIGAPMGGVA